VIIGVPKQVCRAPISLALLRIVSACTLMPRPFKYLAHSSGVRPASRMREPVISGMGRLVSIESAHRFAAALAFQDRTHPRRRRKNGGARWKNAWCEILAVAAPVGQLHKIRQVPRAPRFSIRESASHAKHPSAPGARVHSIHRMIYRAHLRALLHAERLPPSARA